MPAETDGVITQVSQATDGGPPLGAATSGAGGASDPGTQETGTHRETQQTAAGKVQHVPHAAFERIKTEQFNKGKAAALEDLAQRSGFEDSNALAAALAQLKSGRQPPHQQQEHRPKPGEGEGEDGLTPEQVKGMRQEKREIARYEKMNEKMLGERNRYAAQAVEARKQVSSLEGTIMDLQAERELMRTAFEVGLKDVDYAIRLLNQHVSGLTPQQVEQFDERAYFGSLRKERPYLFGETVQPVTTGAGPSGAPPPPRPGAASAAAATGGHVDARKMAPAEWQAHLRARGLQ